MSERLKELAALTRNLSVLYAEDDAVARLVTEDYLHNLFKEVFLAEDGEEALKIFHSQKIDLIITDNIMPGMTGIELMREIRKADPRIPVILITAHIDNTILMDAINNRVTQFIAKPMSLENLFDALEASARIAVFENVSQKVQAQEIELLRYREKYHSGQQQMAFTKELNIMRNDLFLRSLEAVRPEALTQSWLVESSYRPLDVMGGDGYSVRDLGEGRVLLFVLDAMGKGLSASVTSVMSASFINHIIDTASEAGGVLLREIIGHYIAYITKDLLDDEIVCATFLLLDFSQETAEMAAFGMPELLGLRLDGALVAFPSNNLPIMKHGNTCETDRIDISGLANILLYTDGLNECVTHKKALYGSRLQEDFAGALFLKNLEGLFLEAVEKPEDDVTLLFVKRLRRNLRLERHFSVKTSVRELGYVTEELEQILCSASVRRELCARFIGAFTEVSRNAYEHGNLNISSHQKNRLIAEDLYDEFLLEQEEASTASIDISLFIYEDSGHEVLTVTVTDEGRGFNIQECVLADSTDEEFSGRGIRMVREMVDALYYNREGNTVALSIDLSERER